MRIEQPNRHPEDRHHEDRHREDRHRQDRHYHVARARTELDIAYRAAQREATARHVELASLHLREARLHRTPLTGPAAKEYDWLQDLAYFHSKCLGPGSD